MSLIRLFFSAVILVCVVCVCPTFSISFTFQQLPASKIVPLGEMLYFDKRLSADGKVSCATCHDPAAAFASKDTVAIGARSKIGTRNVPTIVNAKFGVTFFLGWASAYPRSAGKAAACFSALFPLFTDFKFYNTGVGGKNLVRFYNQGGHQIRILTLKYACLLRQSR